MKTIIHNLLNVGLVVSILSGSLAFASIENRNSTIPPRLAHQTIEGHIVAKGAISWEERLPQINEFRLKRAYLVLQIVYSSKEFVVLEFEPWLISIEQFKLGEKIQAQLAADGTIISAKHVY